jgi:pyruvate,water dikinase
MRWEEHWDASLRIRHLFLKTPLPARLLTLMKERIETEFQGQAIALRSSASAEDLADASFAGIYESYLNLKTWQEIERHIRLVWASLWSDAALLYQKELKLDVEESAMATICQIMVPSDKAGVAFSRNPLNSKEALIEAVYGLNQGLVDGDVEPDRWSIDRETGRILTENKAEHTAQMSPASKGVILQPLLSNQAPDPVLSQQEIARIFSDLKRVENLFHSPQDMEWTFQGNSLYILQARPITTLSRRAIPDRRAFDLSLRRSFTNLQKLGDRIEMEWLPALMDEADSFSGIELEELSDAALAEEIESRRRSYEKWKSVYWEDFIPFAHGTRLFGRIYNERVQPADPYEFVELLTTSQLESLKRNQELEKLAQALKPSLEERDISQLQTERAWQKRMNDFFSRHNHMACQLEQCHEEKQALWNILQEMAKTGLSHSPAKGANAERLVQNYLSTFDEEEREFAESLLALAKKSYRLRDDDNIYLGRIEALLQAALREARSRSKDSHYEPVLQGNIEEALRALKWNPLGLKSSKDIGPEVPDLSLSARQLRGQPAGPGIARGPARVILKSSDLFAFKKQEILVCDAIDPNMTFAIPIAAAIVERRGGMLIHGAIIAREYGIPCVTGIPRATEFIQTGDHLTVDGYYGLVIINSADTEAQRA